MKHSRTDDKKLALMLKAMLTGASIGDLVKICGSEATAYRYLNVLEDVYDVGISNQEKLYKIISVADDAVWRMVFNEVL